MGTSEWVNFEMFKCQTIKRMLQELYLELTHDVECTNLPFGQFMVAYSSDHFDTAGSNGWEQCSSAIEFGDIETIPDYIVMIFKGEDEEAICRSSWKTRGR